MKMFIGTFHRSKKTSGILVLMVVVVVSIVVVELTKVVDVMGVMA